MYTQAKLEVMWKSTISLDAFTLDEHELIY
jgi:hypothetical protein